MASHTRSARLCLWLTGWLCLALAAQAAPLTIARLKYDGGGDWYCDPTSLPNLLAFTRQNTTLDVAPREEVVEADDPRLFAFPYLYMSGHGRIQFTPLQAERLREWLIGGGFLHVDDNYGLDEHFRREIRKVFPEYELVEVPFSHPIYHSQFDYGRGLPKIHEHDGKPPRGFGIFHEGRLVVFYSWECDLGDGWEDPDVHNDPADLRRQALEMGCNILVWSMGQ
ncbi:MAG: DUF4159 domain-containing protein [Calditrichaeota bacterium]|nr:DUF4159 domain-containing protein [Candidatus Cloacimonadota bacterium]MCB1045826.1 DUF4159 domain-containing protein [Calditrichota bacterium]